jgi:hypothetical protein
VCAGTRRKKKGHEHKNDAEQSLLLKINKEEEWLVYTIPLLLFPLGFQPGPGGSHCVGLNFIFCGFRANFGFFLVTVIGCGLVLFD